MRACGSWPRYDTCVGKLGGEGMDTRLLDHFVAPIQGHGFRPNTEHQTPNTCSLLPLSGYCPPFAGILLADLLLYAFSAAVELPVVRQIRL